MQYEVMQLISVMTVFDANYASNEDCEKIVGLDVNSAADVQQAAKLLLLEEFNFPEYSEQSRKNQLAALRFFVADPTETFERLFSQIGLIFDDPESMDKRAFMAAVLAALEAQAC